MHGAESGRWWAGRSRCPQQPVPPTSPAPPHELTYDHVASKVLRHDQVLLAVDDLKRGQHQGLAPPREVHHLAVHRGVAVPRLRQAQPRGGHEVDVQHEDEVGGGHAQRAVAERVDGVLLRVQRVQELAHQLHVQRAPRRALHEVVEGVHAAYDVLERGVAVGGDDGHPARRVAEQRDVHHRGQRVRPGAALVLQHRQPAREGGPGAARRVGRAIHARAGQHRGAAH